MSQPLGMNLARRPFTNDLLVWSGVGVLLASVLGLSLWNGGHFLATGSQVREMTARRQALDEETRQAGQREQSLTRTIEASRSELLASRATFANTIIQSHAFSWTRLFNELEKVMPLGVRLVNIRPRIDGGIRIRMNGVARNSQAFWEWQENLDKWPVFGNVYPDAVSPSASRAGITAGELIVSVEAEYFPEARLRLGLPDEEPSLVEAAAQTAAPAPAAAVPGPVPPPAAGVPPDDSAGETGAAAGQQAPQGDPMVRRGKRGRRGQVNRPARAGVQRETPLPEGAPGLKKPDISSAPRPEVPQGFQRPNVQSVTEDGRMLDADGNEITIEDIINRPHGIQPGPPRVDEGAQPAGTEGGRQSQGSEVEGGADGSQADPVDQEQDAADEEEDR